MKTVLNLCSAVLNSDLPPAPLWAEIEANDWRRHLNYCKNGAQIFWRETFPIVLLLFSPPSPQHQQYCQQKQKLTRTFSFLSTQSVQCVGCVFYFVMLDLCSGEDSGKVMIWNMAPVLREEDEKNESIPKMLCQLDNHLGKMSPLKCLLVTNDFLIYIVLVSSSPRSSALRILILLKLKYL